MEQKPIKPKTLKQKVPGKSVECHILQKFEKPNVFFLLNGLIEPYLGERIELIKAINREPNSAVAWNNMLNHVKAHNTKTTEASGRDRLFRRAQTLIPETCSSKEYVNIWLNYIQEQQHASGSADRIRSVFEYMNNRKIGTAFFIFYEKWSEFESSLGNSVTSMDILQKFKTVVGDPKSETAFEPHSSTTATSSMLPARTKKVEELPDYIKNFDFKKLQHDKKKSKDLPNTAVVVEASKGSEKPSATSSSSINRTGLQHASETTLLSKQTGSQAKRTLLRTGGAMRVPVSSNNDESDKKRETVHNENHISEDGAETKRVKVEEEDLEMLSPQRPILMTKLEGTPLEPVTESSFESNASSSRASLDSTRSGDTSRRDSMSSLSSGDKSTTSINANDLGEDEDATIPLDSSFITSSQQLQEDETAVIFKHHTQFQGKSTPGSALSKRNEDETDVIFKYKSTPISAIPQREVASANSSSITYEAGNRGSSHKSQSGVLKHQQQRHQQPVMRKLNDNLDNDSSGEENGDVDTDEINHDDHVNQSMTNKRSSGGSQDSFKGNSMFGESNMVLVNHKKYIKIGTLGKGGSSKVYRVIAEESGEIYALKRIKVHSDDPKFMKSFINEIQLMESLRNKPCIVQLVGSEIIGRTIHMVMEAGETDLHGVLQRHQAQGSLSANFVRLAWQEMLTAVQVIHEHRIVHGDLKPANFLFVQGHLKLIDFGIAKQINCDTVNITRDVQVGTLNYMSPEAIKDSGGSNEVGKPRMKLGRASDIWSLGCILYQMVYAKTPFAHITSFVPKMMAIVDEKHHIPYQKLKDKSVEEAIRSCLQRDPSQRPPISGPNGLLKQRFLEPSQQAVPESCSSNNGMSLSSVKQIIRRTLEESNLSKSSNLEEIEARVIEKLRKEPTTTQIIHHENPALPPPPPRTSSTSNSTSSLASVRPQRTHVLKDLGSVSLKKVASNNSHGAIDKENRQATSINQNGNLKDEIAKQLGKLRSVSDSVASKYQKPVVTEAGGDGIFSAMKGSNLLLKTGIEKRRQDIMPSEETMNTQCWGNEESWQS